MLYRLALLVVLLGSYDRIVAIVGNEAILASEVLARAAPFWKRVDETAEKDELKKIERQLLAELVVHMVDERLIEHFATEHHFFVTAQEIDHAIAEIGKNWKLAPDQVIAEAKKQGFAENEYREELRRSLLEAKASVFFMAGEPDAEHVHTRMLTTLRQKTYVEIRTGTP